MGCLRRLVPARGAESCKMLRDPAGKTVIPFISSSGLSVTDVQGKSSFFLEDRSGGASYPATAIRFSLRSQRVLFFQLFFRNVRPDTQPEGSVVQLIFRIFGRVIWVVCVWICRSMREVGKLRNAEILLGILGFRVSFRSGLSEYLDSAGNSSY